MPVSLAKSTDAPIPAIEELARQYPFIVAWGRHIGSFNYYVDEELRKADRDGAPVTAVFHSYTQQRWVSIGEFTYDENVIAVTRAASVIASAPA